MSLLRRFEFWVVTAFVLFGAAYVWVTQSLHQRLQAPPEVVQVVLDPVAPPPPPEGGAEAAQSLPFAVESVSWRAEGTVHWLLEMKVRYRNDSEAPEVLARPKAGVVTGGGEEVPPFFLAAAPLPQVPPKTESTVELRYWLGDQQARGELWLEVDGQRTRLEGPPERM
ncbi:MAG: hypothetical protein DVB23_002330 [Verrucomicrobia bacterium]|nr:MAG: hypothetical protein DVB23_002330 [Verrucomicrobiota bacterium]